MSLANKYRPTTFDTTIGQSHISDILKSKIISNSFTNCNYIFYGPRGTGKTSTARILSKAMNCLDLHDGNPCNKCENCIAINEGKTVDYVEIDAASYTGVDNIREEILDKVDYPPTQLKRKIYVIDEVHMLSKSAFNALLKTIEEPKDYIVFIMATTDIHKVPDTVISRCQIFNFKKVGEKDMVSHLQDICNQESLPYDIEALTLISKISEGCMRDAIKYVDQVSIFGNINVENVTNFLGIAGDKLIADFLETIKGGDKTKIFNMVDDISNRGIDLSQLVKQIIVYIDQNLNSDLEFLLSVSEIFGDINATVRYYPYPNIAYKIAINKYLNEHNIASIGTAPMGTTGTNSTKGNGADNIEKSPDTIMTKVERNDNGNNNERQIEESLEYNKRESDDIHEKSSDSIKHESHSEDDTDWIKEQLISKLSNNTTKTNIKEYVFIKGIEGNTITLIYINKIAEISLKRDEREIGEVLNEILGKSMVLELQFQDKNEFFASQLL